MSTNHNIASNPQVHNAVLESDLKDQEHLHTVLPTDNTDDVKGHDSAVHVKSGNDIYASAEHVTYTPQEGRKVLWKIDLILLMLLQGCYIFSFLDKTLINYSSIFGLKQDLHLHGSDYSWTASIFYFGYMFGSVAWSKLVHRFPQHVGKMISGAVLIWSIIVLLTPLCKSWDGLMANRFFLGTIESITGPIFVIVTSNWWTRPEQAFRTGFWLMGTPIGNFLGGLLSYAVGRINSKIEKWKLFFVFFGSFSFFFALCMIALMPDNQANAWWLNAREKKIAIERVRENQTVSNETEWKWSHFWEALKDPQTTFFFVIAICGTMPSVFASQFSSQIVKGFGFTSLQTTLVSTCPAAVIQFSSNLISCWLAGRYPNSNLIISSLSSIPPLIGACLLRQLPDDNLAGKLVGYYLTYTHTIAGTLSTGLRASNYAGQTKKATANSVIQVGWAAGLIAGPQFFLDREAPKFQTAFIMLIITYALSIIVPWMQRAWYIYENKKREKKTDLHLTTEELEFTDQSDFEQWRTFRYAM